MFGTQYARIFREPASKSSFEGDHEVIEGVAGVDRKVPIGEVPGLSEEEQLDVVTYGGRDQVRREAREAVKSRLRGQRKFTRQQRKAQYVEQTRQAQLALLRSSDPAHEQMQQNLIRGIEQAQRERDRAAEREIRIDTTTVSVTVSQ